jgi:glutathione synthase/RimK-type ligase-like ATP-grasp enzyme
MRTDLSEFPSRSTIRAELGSGGSWSGRLAGPAREMQLENLRAVWWRKPSPFSFPVAMSGPERAFGESQARRAFSGVLGSLPEVLWVNRPEAIAGCTKPQQLAAAVRAGLDVPKTLITSDPEAVAEFASRCGGEIVTKSLGSIRYSENGKTGRLYTARVPSEAWADPRISLTAHLFQREIVDKAYEIRVTAVNRRLFPVAIRTPEGPGRLDWRRDISRLSYKPVPLPSAVEEGVHILLHNLGLVFAALDFIVDAAGTHYLVDVNANGQWAWIPNTRDAIARALADLLEKGLRSISM